jgi:hypothetical protein
MALYASGVKGGGGDGDKWKKFLHPKGSFVAKCIDVIDLGMVDEEWEGVVKKKHKIVLRFWAGQYNEDNQPVYASQRFTLSLHENAALRPFLVGWRGEEFTDAELKKFDVESLIGQDAYITVVQVKKGDKVFANVKSAAMPPSGMSIDDLPDYVRVGDREQVGEPPVASGSYKDRDDGLPW